MADLPRLPSPADYEDVGVSGEEAPAGNKESIFVGILETLQQNNFVLNEVSESADIIEENTASDESQSERRNRRVEEENTDKPGMFSKAIGGLGAGVRGVGGILNKANPFQEGGLGPKMSILLISGVLFAISKFGDKLIKPLAAVLEAFDSEGGILDKLKNTELFKGVVETFEKIGADISERFETFSTDIKAKFETIGDDIETAFEEAKTTFTEMGETIKTMGGDIEKLLVSVTTVAGFVKGAYDSIMEYINSFDTQGAGPRNEYADGKLDALEMQNLKEDVIGKIKNLVTELVTSTVGGITTSLIAFFALGGIGYAIIKGIAMGTAARITAGLGGGSGGDGPPRRSSRGNLVKNLAKSLVVGTSAFSSSVGATSKAASLKPGQAINKAGSIYDTKSGRIVKPASAFSHLSKYPRLMAAAKRIPLLTPLLTGALAVDTMTDDELSKEEKILAMGGILGGGLGAMGFGALGATLGTTFGPPGTVIGSILGSLTGFVAGEKLGEVLAGFLLGKEREAIPLQSSSTLGSMMNPDTGEVETVESLPIQIMSASTGEYPQANVVSQLQGNLMNRNTDLAIAAYEADKAKKLKSTSTPLPGDRDTSNTPLSMPVVIDKGQVTNIQSNYGSRLNVDNGNSTSRLFGDSLLIDVRGSLAGGF